MNYKQVSLQENKIQIGENIAFCFRKVDYRRNSLKKIIMKNKNNYQGFVI